MIVRSSKSNVEAIRKSSSPAVVRSGSGSPATSSQGSTPSSQNDMEREKLKEQQRLEREKVCMCMLGHVSFDSLVVLFSQRKQQIDMTYQNDLMSQFDMMF